MKQKEQEMDFCQWIKNTDDEKGNVPPNNRKNMTTDDTVTSTISSAVKRTKVNVGCPTCGVNVLGLSTTDNRNTKAKTSILGRIHVTKFFLISVIVAFMARITFIVQPTNIRFSNGIVLFLAIVSFLLLCLFLVMFVWFLFLQIRRQKQEEQKQNERMFQLQKMNVLPIRHSPSSKAETKNYAQILSQAIQCQTISYDSWDEKNHDKEKYFHEQATKLHHLLEVSFPTLHALFPPKKISTYSLLYEICPEDDPVVDKGDGRDSLPMQSNLKKDILQDKAHFNTNHLRPILFCSHFDVVPATSLDARENSDYDSKADDNDNTMNPWTHDPFQGIVQDGYIWGRGAIDNKQNMIGQLAAIEKILLSPNRWKLLQRTIFIAIGHDEEIGGHNGAANIARYFQQRNLTFEYILDEGNLMIAQVVPGQRGHLAMIGTVEKGLMNVEVSVSGLGGHASMPPIGSEKYLNQNHKMSSTTTSSRGKRNSLIDMSDRRIVSMLCRALLALEENPMPSHFEPSSPLRRMLQIIAQKQILSFPMNIICSNLWFFGPLLKFLMTKMSPGSAASVRTTTAITRIMGGEKINSLPNQVQAYINHRIHPNDTMDSVLLHDRNIINNPRVSLRLLHGNRPPSPDSGDTGSGYKMIEDCVHFVFGYPSAPSLVVGNTDTFWYWQFSDQIYRFCPIAMNLKDVTMIHGIDEKISIEALTGVVDFYETLIMLSGSVEASELYQDTERSKLS